MAELAQKAALRLTKAASPVGPGNVPTLGEFVAGYEAGAMNGIGVPRNTPLQIIGRLNVVLSQVPVGAVRCCRTAARRA
jgi:hypothetical protein